MARELRRAADGAWYPFDDPEGPSFSSVYGPSAEEAWKKAGTNPGFAFLIFSEPIRWFIEGAMSVDDAENFGASETTPQREADVEVEASHPAAHPPLERFEDFPPLPTYSSDLEKLREHSKRVNALSLEPTKKELSTHYNHVPLLERWQARNRINDLHLDQVGMEVLAWNARKDASSSSHR